MSARKQLAAVAKAASGLADEIGKLESRVRELEYADGEHQFGEIESILNIDGTPTVWIGESVDYYKITPKFAEMVEELVENADSGYIEGDRVAVMRMWRKTLANAVARLDGWLAINGEEGKR